MSKQFWGVIVVIVLIFIGIFAFTGNKSNDSTKNSSSKSSTSQPTSHISGKGSTGVTLVEYGDYQCPYCEGYAAVVKDIQTEYNDKIFFQFRNFPLPSLHPNAFAAARAAEAAGLQNKFWEMHDMLYQSSNWSDWKDARNPNTLFEQYATSLGLNIAKFKSDFQSDQVNNLINEDMKAGDKLNVSGTPTFFIDGKQVTINPDKASFEKVINAAIAAKSANKSQ